MFVGARSQVFWSYTSAAAPKSSSDQLTASQNTPRMNPRANQPPRTPHASPAMSSGAKSSRKRGPKTRPPHHSAYVAYAPSSTAHGMSRPAMRSEMRPRVVFAKRAITQDASARKAHGS